MNNYLVVLDLVVDMLLYFYCVLRFSVFLDGCNERKFDRGMGLRGTVVWIAFLILFVIVVYVPIELLI